MPLAFFKKKRKKDLFTIAFYNLENLFDTKDDPHTLDDDFTPAGPKKWTGKRYKRKKKKLARTIAAIGSQNTGRGPVLVGVAEVENHKVIRDLIQTTPLKGTSYDFVHFDSPDERGIDTALLYDKRHFQPLYTETLELHIDNADGKRDTTRDILYVKGSINNEEVHVFVNHWPSRRAGEDLTEHKRVKAADTIISYMTELESKYENPSFIIMGDFNDGPEAKSIKYLVKEKDLYNPMEKLLTPERGSANYRRSWSLFDQIIVSHNFFNYERGTHSFANANIYDEYFLTEWKGKYRGNPFRTYVGRKYKGGYSDHFPVFIQLKFND